MSEALRFELRPFGMRVNLVEPGGVRANYVHPYRDHPAYEPRFSGQVHAMMAAGGERSAAPAAVAATILAAADIHRSDRLRYVATNAGRMLRLNGLARRTACAARTHRQGSSRRKA